MPSRRPRRRPTEARLDLARVRLLKRLLKRCVRELEDIERTLLRFGKADRQRPLTEAERDAVDDLYAIARELPKLEG